jgi:hypothetical protein
MVGTPNYVLMTFDANQTTFEAPALEALDVNSDAIAFAQLTYAYSTGEVNAGRR